MNASRLGGWAVSVVAVVLTAYPANRLCAQHGTVGAHLAFGDYREVSSDLHYRGSGGGVAGSFTFRKLGIEASVAGITYDPVKGSSATVSFKATQLDVRVRYEISGPVSAEVGFVNRKIKPEFEAQSMGAVRAGVRLSYPLGPGVQMGLRGGMLFGSKFSGGGTVSGVGALELGLNMAVDALRGRLRLTGDYDFQRIARTTNGGGGDVAVPIQQALGRLGLAVAF
jgi:hypothetical protein